LLMALGAMLLLAMLKLVLRRQPGLGWLSWQ
jgi:hypothetical protein